MPFSVGLITVMVVLVTEQKEVNWLQALLRGTYAQRTEIIALTQTLHWTEGKW